MSASGEVASKPAAPNVWLDAWQDPVANAHAYSQCITTADTSGDGDWRLIIATADKKLKVYTGTSQTSEHNLQEYPAGVVAFNSDAAVPRLASLAVAAGPNVYIYRNLRPYFKFALPPLDVDAEERDAWDAFRAAAAPDCALADRALADRALAARLFALRELRSISPQSAELLAIEDEPSRAEAAARLAALDKLLAQPTSCTCAAVIPKAIEEPDAISCAVIGTESGHVLILDASGTSLLLRVAVPSVPTILSVVGVLDVDYRIAIAGRNNAVYLVKNGQLAATAIELEAAPCGLAQTTKLVLVACMNHAIHAYHTKGKKAYSIYLPAPIVAMTLISVARARLVRALLVALGDGEVRVYNDRALVSCYQAGEALTGARFGRLGREESVLVTASRSGALAVKILQRKCTLEAASVGAGPPAEQDVPLAIPKKTKLYVEQAQREREQSVAMHRAFQRDLCKMRLATARAYVRTLSATPGGGGGGGPAAFAAATASASLRVNATVQGLGPLFKIRVSFVNTGAKVLTNVPVLYAADSKFYRLSRAGSTLPLLVPGLDYTDVLLVTCMDPMGGADAVRITVCNRASCIPVLSAVVKMPLSEVLDA